MSEIKKSFRTRPIDINRPLNIHIGELQLSEDDFEENIYRVQKPKFIPIPDTAIVEIEETRKSDFVNKNGYIKYIKTFDDEKRSVLYDLEEDDFEWLSKNEQLKDDEMELLMDIFEKETGLSDELIEFDEINFDSYKTIESKKLKKKVYDHWRKKREKRIEKLYPKCGRPLLGEYEIPPDPNELSPNIAFRPRLDEKQVIRKYRKNDEESYTRLNILKQDLEQLKDIAELVLERERLKQIYAQNTMSLLKMKLSNIDKSSEMTFYELLKRSNHQNDHQYQQLQNNKQKQIQKQLEQQEMNQEEILLKQQLEQKEEEEEEENENEKKPIFSFLEYQKNIESEEEIEF
eukprot:gene3473-6122_t